ncbi:hypothetical protein PMAYCL1PPCAC_30763 [Pristionchus mayeri]|uniref:C2H2-type domain-containing protein n=1 Tax=Pristionchus mayeri TaxID=1317129 RepID=A0AAN5IC02_9BILA|nr:hypothetical protein PMAYCL1PPCAC_30763 [Pristionchus mayeri]
MRTRSAQAGKGMEELPEKKPKVEPPEEVASTSEGAAGDEEAKEFLPLPDGLDATGTVSYHIKGQIFPEQLMNRRVHPCEYCKFTAMTDDKLISHREQTHKIFLCRFCKTEFSSRFQQHSHFPVCERLTEMRNKVKKQRAEIQDRKHTHDSIRCMHVSVKCPICKDEFENMFDLGDHRKHPCKSYAVRLFACSGCNAQFTTANGLKSHLIAKYNEKDYKCYNSGVLSYDNMKIPKFTRRGAHVYGEHLPINHTPVTLRLIPIKNEPTLPDEMHDDRTKHALVAAHLLSDHDGTMTTEYYYAMRKMFYRIDCPFCGIQCRTHAALHSHGLIHHPPHERCLYQCGGCEYTYQTPTGLGQHLKREFDDSNPRCYNTVNLVRKQDYLGQVTGWNKKCKKIDHREPHVDQEILPNTVDVKPDPDYLEDLVKKEEPDDGYELAPGASGTPSGANFLVNDSEVKIEPLDG